ncbi:MAG: AI-2E family transporter [Desulfomonile sp.]
MTPTAKRTLMRIGAAVAFFAILVWLMRALESVTTMVMVAFFIAYILDPLVSTLETRGIRRQLSVMFILFSGLLLVAGIFTVLIPAIFGEIYDFAAKVPRYVTELRDVAFNIADKIDLRIPTDWGEVTPVIIEKARQLIPSLADPAGRIVSSIFKSTFGILSAILHTLLVPVIAYYLLVSFGSFRDEITDLIPMYTREPVMDRLREIDRVLAAFVRGQLTIAAILGVLYSIGFTLIGIDLAIVLGISCGILWIIPYMGTMVAIVVGSAMALAKYGDLVHVAYVWAWIAMVQLLEGYVLTPRIVGKAIGLHPVVYILALIVGANLFGFVGMLVAIPVTAVLRVLLLTGVEAYRRSPLYNDPASEKSGEVKEN